MTLFVKNNPGQNENAAGTEDATQAENAQETELWNKHEKPKKN